MQLQMSPTEDFNPTADYPQGMSADDPRALPLSRGEWICDRDSPTGSVYGKWAARADLYVLRIPAVFHDLAWHWQITGQNETEGALIATDTRDLSETHGYPTLETAQRAVLAYYQRFIESIQS
jgi:hypothetical protein